MGPVKARLFSSVFVLVGGLILFVGLKSVLKAGASSSWPTVDGKVASSRVDSTRGDKGGTIYHAEVLYEFTLGGSIHSSNKVSFGQYGSSDPSHARSIVNKYPSGRHVTVYYSPGNPDVCVLEPGITGMALLLPGIGAVFLIGGVLLFIFLPRSMT